MYPIFSGKIQILNLTVGGHIGFFTFVKKGWYAWNFRVHFPRRGANIENFENLRFPTKTGQSSSELMNIKLSTLLNKYEIKNYVKK